MGRLLTTFKDKTFEPSMKSYFQLYTDDTSTASQIYDSLLYVRGINAGSLAKNQENDDDVSTVEEYDTYMPIRFYNVKSKSDGSTPASPTHTFFNVYNRAEYAGPDGQNMYDLYADYNIAKLSGASYITNSIGGAVNYGIDGGSGDDQTIPAVYGAYNWAKSQPTGSNRTVTYLMASRNRSHLNKSDATATYVYSTTSEFTQTTGDVGTLALHKFDLDYTAGNITNAYFIWANEDSLPTPSGEKYFIKSNIGWPTLLSGSLTNTGAVTFNSTLSVSGTATLSSNVNIGGNLVVTGTSTFNGGTITIGDAASDNVVFGADVDSHIIPDDDNTYDLGSSTQEWRDLYIDGTAYIDVLSLSNNLDLADNIAVRFGNSQDLQIYHDASDSYIQQTGTGDLIIENTTDDKDIKFKSDNGSGGTEIYINVDGSARATKFVNPTFHNDTVKAKFGSDSDLEIYFDGHSRIENNTGDFVIQTNLDDGDIKFRADDGTGGIAEYVRIDGGAQKTLFFEKTEHQDSVKAQFGNSGDLNIFHDGTDSKIENDTGDLYIRNNSDDRDIYFQTDDGSGGITTYFMCDGSLATSGFTTTLWGDQMQIALGDGRDLRLWHQSSNNYIAAYTGDLYIKNETDDGDVIFQNDNGSGGLSNYIVLDGGDVSIKMLTQKVIMSNLPTSNPNNAGQLYNDSGTLKVSAG